MWPNRNNYSSFGIEKKKIFKKKFYIYKNSQKTSFINKTINYPIKDLIRFKPFLDFGCSFFYKDLDYLKKRYLKYKSQDYFINKLEFNTFASFFIIKK